MIQDLNWIKSLFENYKAQFSKEAVSAGLCTIPEHLYKTEAANELLEEIKRFIKAANVLVEKNNGEKQD